MKALVAAAVWFLFPLHARHAAGHLLVVHCLLAATAVVAGFALALHTITGSRLGPVMALLAALAWLFLAALPFALILLSTRRRCRSAANAKNRPAAREGHRAGLENTEAARR